MSSSGMPLTTLRAEERRHEDRVVGLDLGRAGGQRRPARRRRARRAATDAASGTVDSDGTRPQSGSSASPPRLIVAEAVHHAQALEGVLAVEQPALVDLAQVALDVGAGERGAAEQHRDARPGRGRSAPRGCRA